MEFLLQIAFACPKCWRIVGGVLSTVCFALLVTSLKLARRVDGLESRFNVALPDQVIDALPLATSIGEFICLGAGLLCGIYFIYFGGWVKRWI